MLFKAIMNYIFSTIWRIMKSIKLGIRNILYKWIVFKTQQGLTRNPSFCVLLLDELKECFFVLNKVAETRGYGLYKQLNARFEYRGLKVENITGASFDRWLLWCKKIEYHGVCGGEYWGLRKGVKKENSTIHLLLGSRL